MFYLISKADYDAARAMREAEEIEPSFEIDDDEDSDTPPRTLNVNM